MTCDEVSHLISIGVDSKLSLLQRTRIQMHLFFCRRCRNFRDFVMLLQRKARQIQTADLSGFPSLSDDVKEHIVSSLNRQYGTPRHTDDGNDFSRGSV